MDVQRVVIVGSLNTSPSLSSILCHHFALFFELEKINTKKERRNPSVRMTNCPSLVADSQHVNSLPRHQSRCVPESPFFLSPTIFKGLSSFFFGHNPLTFAFCHSYALLQIHQSHAYLARDDHKLSRGQVTQQRTDMMVRGVKGVQDKDGH